MLVALKPPTSAHHVWQSDSPINALVWGGWEARTLVAALGDGTVACWRPELAQPLMLQMPGKVTALQAVAVQHEVVVSGDDGCLQMVTPEVEMLPLPKLEAKDWPEALVALPRLRAVAVAMGKAVWCVFLNGKPPELLHKSAHTVAGLALAPNGQRLAVSHYNGVTLLNLENPKVPPRVLEWQGIHGVVTYSPDGKWVVSAMQDQTLHLWRLSDGYDLHMRGYPSKIHSVSWSFDGGTLATSGGVGVPLWNFKGPNGPAGMAANVVGEGLLFQEDTVQTVAMHPNGPFVAAGWRQNGVHLIDIIQDKSVPLWLDAMLGEGLSVGPVTALAWRPDGHMLAMGSQKASLCVIDFKMLLG